MDIPGHEFTLKDALAAHYRRNDMNAALEGLDALFDVKAAREAGEVAPVITEWAKSKQMELVRTAELPRIAPLAERAGATTHRWAG